MAPLSRKTFPLSHMLAHFRESPRIPRVPTDNLVAPGLEPGTLNRHITDTNMTELASVIDTKTDEFGIRHTRFLLAYQYQHRVIEAGERTLAIAVVATRFGRTSDPAPPPERSAGPVHNTDSP